MDICGTWTRLSILTCNWWMNSLRLTSSYTVLRYGYVHVYGTTNLHTNWAKHYAWKRLSSVVNVFQQAWGCFKKHLWAPIDLLYLHLWIKSTSFNVRVRYFVWNFKGTIWNSTQNILPAHWKIWFLYNIKILRALRFKSSDAFVNTPGAYEPHLRNEGYIPLFHTGSGVHTARREHPSVR